MEKINNYYTGVNFGIFKIVGKEGIFYKIKSIYLENFNESYVINTQLQIECREATFPEIDYFNRKEKEVYSADTEQTSVTK